MSITVRNWTPQDLGMVRGRNPWMTTLLANCTTFNTDMIRALNGCRKLRTFLCHWDNDDEPVKIKAVDLVTLARFIDGEYTHRPVYITEVKTTYSDVTLP